MSGGEALIAAGVLKLHFPRQQFVDAVDRVLCDALEDMPQVGLRVDAVELDRADESVNRGGAAAAGVGAGKQVVAAPERDAA